MSKRVVVIASGETERLSLPLLLDHLAAEGITVEDVRIPPRHRAIKVEVAEKIIRSVWFEHMDDERPHKFVVLVDTDASSPEEALSQIRTRLPARLQDISASIQFAYAQQHLVYRFQNIMLVADATMIGPVTPSCLPRGGTSSSWERIRSGAKWA